LLASSLTATGVPISPVEGASFTGTVAQFTDADKNTNPAAYTATIKWGDGQTTAGTVTADPKAGFDVGGTHTYAEEGPSSISVQINDSDTDTASIQITNIVSDAPLTATGVTLNATQDRTLRNAVVATFNDADPAGKPSDFAATIDWGDGITSTGTVVRDQNGGFDVLGSHRYTAPGAFSVQVQIRDGGRDVTSTQFYTPINLVSDGVVPADHVDPNLINPWGIVASGGSPFWVSDNNAGVSTLYNGIGNPQSLVVTIPGPKGSPPGFVAAPTGVVNNGVAIDFLVNGPGTSAHFIFATEDGTISAWNSGTSAVLKVDNSQVPTAANGAVYKGEAIDTVGTSQFLYVTNFRAGTVEVYDNTFAPHTFSATQFTDANLPAGFAPFGIQNINGNVFVTYAEQNATKHDDVDGAGLGFVDEFSPTGALLQRVGGPGVQPELNAPWGLTIAPSNFGKFSNDLLVGNLGDSHVNAFSINPATGAFVFAGQLSDAQGHPLVLDGGFKGPSTRGLWGLRFGNGTGSGPTNTLFFTSGPNNETDGVLGSVTATSFSTANAPSVVSVSPGHDSDSHDGFMFAMNPDDSASSKKHDGAAFDAALEALQDG
jgi:uncharacterized protein (TIGR03118 family)